MEVVNSGNPIVGALRSEQGIDYTVNMSPLIENQKIVGGISIVSNIEDVRTLSNTINKYENKIRRLENRMRSIHRAKYTLDNIMAQDPLSKKLKEDIRRQAQECFERLIEGMKQAQGITEQLKAENALEWVGRMNNIRACAMEIVNTEIIYA